MFPVYTAGDFILVWKLPFPTFDRTQSVVFTLPEDITASNTYESGSVFIKRIVGLPGDTLTAGRGLVAINGQSTDIPYTDMPAILGDTIIIVPRKGDVIELAPEREVFWRPIIERDGRSIVVQNRIVFIDGSPAVTYVLSQDFYFTVGDNFANSFDSRYWGFLPESAIIGTPLFIYWSSTDDSAIRWERIGSPAR